jgi:hypothetical protein
VGAVAPKINKEVRKKPHNFMILTVNYLIHEISISPKRFVTVPHKRILTNRKRGSEVSVEFWSYIT